MWKKSKPNDYNSFRTFIFGITKQSMFPHGVVYEGVSEEPMSFRGESGANDSMVSGRWNGLSRIVILILGRSLYVIICWKSRCQAHHLRKSWVTSAPTDLVTIANSWNGSDTELRTLGFEATL